MKKTVCLLLAFAMLFSLAACSQPSEPSEPAQNEPVQPQEPQSPDTSEPSGSTDDTAAPSDPEPSADETAEPETGKTLVVYFSATGNTEQAAGYIAEATGGDLFELTPAEPYSDDDLNWRDESSRVVYEYEHPDERDIELTAASLDNWDEYDTIFIGYPIWWGIAAWPVDTFVEANDFTGKTVIPFCTSSSSGLGESGELLAEQAGTGEWLEGHRFSSRVSADDVQAWLDELGL